MYYIYSTVLKSPKTTVKCINMNKMKHCSKRFHGCPLSRLRYTLNSNATVTVYCLSQTFAYATNVMTAG